MDCLICNSETRQKYLKEGTKIYECLSCGLVFYDSNDQNLAEIYSEDYFVNENALQGYNNYFSMEKSLLKTFELRMNNIISKFGLQSGTLLDVGCGPGFFLRVGREKGWQVKGIEISEFAAKVAKEKYGLDVSCGILKTGDYEPQSFDLVTMWDVIEHLQNPEETLKIVNRILKPGGVLALTTGDIGSLFAKICGTKWHLLNIPEHVFYFNKNSIKEALAKTGYEIVDINYESSYYTTRYLFERLEKTMLPMGLVKFFRKIIPEEISIPVNLYDIMTVYAVKK